MPVRFDTPDSGLRLTSFCMICGLSPALSSSVCPVRARLFDEIAAAIRTIVLLRNEELERLISGRPSAFDEMACRKAQQLKASLLQQLREHIAEHGC